MKKNVVKKMLLAIGIALLLAVCTGCVSRLGTFTVISTRNIEWNRASEYQRTSRRVEGSDICHIIVFIPTQFAVNIEDAVDEALDEVPGAVALVDAVVRYKYFYIPYIYGQQGYVVEGSVLIDPKMADIDADDDPVYYMGYYDENRDVKLSKVDEAEYTSLQEKYLQN